MKTFAQGLVADGPALEYRDALMLYGQFVGDWQVEAVDHRSDGSSTRSQWDVRFDWVLEGRAIQDVWITPIRHSEDVVSWHEPGNRYSTTLRIYDPQLDAWHIIWVNPPGGQIIRQLGRRVGSEIVQLGTLDSTGELVRWVYRDIREDTFGWRHERSRDLGASWQLVQEMIARRV